MMLVCERIHYMRRQSLTSFFCAKDVKGNINRRNGLANDVVCERIYCMQRNNLPLYSCINHQEMTELY